MAGQYGIVSLQEPSDYARVNRDRYVLHARRAMFAADETEKGWREALAANCMERAERALEEE